MPHETNLSQESMYLAMSPSEFAALVTATSST